MLLVQPFCAYLASTNCQWRDEDYAAHYYTLMCKGDAEKLASIKTTARNLPLGPNRWPVRVAKNAEGVARVRKHFAGWAANLIRGWGYEQPTIIPIPNSHVTPDVNDFPTWEIATTIGAAVGPSATVNSAVRFQLAMPKSHQGGTRNPDELARNMVTRPGFKAEQVVLVDDVMTSGAHIKAARRVLEQAGIPVVHAIVCARRTDCQEADPFTIGGEDLDALPDFDLASFFD